MNAFVELQASKFCEESARTQAGPVYDHMALCMRQLHQYSNLFNLRSLVLEFLQLK